MKITINNAEWEIKEVDEKIFVDKRECLGSCDWVEKIIKLRKSLVKDFKKEVLLHELAHAFHAEYALLQQEIFSAEELCQFVSKFSTEINDIANEYVKDKILKENDNTHWLKKLLG